MITTAEERSRALNTLAAVLRGQGYRVLMTGYHLIITDQDGRKAEVWAQRRASDNGRLWFTRAGGAPICEATQTMNAVVAVKGMLAAEAGSTP
ncbi:hypothetical protein [Thermomonospora cellulosilytica]|uniref:Uncharacterized protein n=1 Tax=Thermomonospora cellulosilytica TaxID=1411118 RepID=A0A7W3R756_9ACTN|nr:hypothetical protein [Thermomonospora cellulosilytica]MBA9002266.1 hypothetical protein [Thermomonospora cellulosilytica]